MGAKFKSKEVWNGVPKKFEKRLATWQMQYLSMGGMLTLINSVLDSLPTYHVFVPNSNLSPKADGQTRKEVFTGRMQQNTQIPTSEMAQANTTKIQGRLGPSTSTQQSYALKMALDIWTGGI